MSTENHEFKLSREELVYLKQLVSKNDTLTDMVSSAKPSHDDQFTIGLSREAAEQLRDFFTEQLAVVGFDKNYAPTEEGKMLEELIDRFYF